MKKLMIHAIFVFCVLSFGAEYWVNASVGSEENDGSEMHPWLYISTAITAAATTYDGEDIVHLSGVFSIDKDPGLVREDKDKNWNSGLNIRQSVKLVGEDPLTTIVQAADSFDEDYITWRIFYIRNINTSTNIDVKFENMTIRYGRGYPSGGIYALLSRSGSKLTIKNCSITDNHFRDSTGVYRGGSAVCCTGDLEIKNSLIMDNKNEIESVYYWNGCAGVFWDPATSYDECIIENTVFLRNKSFQSGGALCIKALGSSAPYPIYTTKIKNCTFSHLGWRARQSGRQDSPGIRDRLPGFQHQKVALADF